MFEVNEIAEMTLQGQKSKSLEKKKKKKKNNNNMNLRHHLTCRFAAGKKVVSSTFEKTTDDLKVF